MLNRALTVIFLLLTLGTSFLFSFPMEISSCFAVNAPQIDSRIKITQAEWGWLKDHESVRVRVSKRYPPFEFYEDDTYQGIAVDYLDEVFSRLGMKYQVASDMPWTEALNRLRAGGGIDLILLITHTPEREEFIQFTEDYISYPQVIFTGKDAPFISGIHDLSGRSVAVESGYIMKTWLERDVPDVRFLEFESSGEALRAVSAGKAFAYVGNIAVGQFHIEKMGLLNLKVAAPTIYKDDAMAMGVRKDWPELAVLINKALESMTTQEHKAIKQRWLVLRYEHGISLLDIITWVLLVAVLALLWITQLRRVVRRRTKELEEEITFRRQTEESLCKSEQNYREIFNATNEAIFIHDAGTGAILDVNEPMLKMYGYERSEALRLKIGDLSLGTSPHGEQEATEWVRKAVEKGPQTFEWRARRRNGEHFWVEVSLRRSMIGGEDRVLAVVRDIAERKKAEDQLKLALKQAEVLLQEVHHRVKNNMQIITSLLHLQIRSLRGSADIEALREAINRIRSMALVHEELYRTDDIAYVGFRSYLEGTARNLFKSYGIDETRIKLNTDRIEETDTNIDTAIPCGLIVCELVSNALKYAFPDNRTGEVKIELKKINGQFKLTISDDGVGFPADIDYLSTDSLGLQLVRILAEQLSGTVDLFKQKGTVFQIHFFEIEQEARLVEHE